MGSIVDDPTYNRIYLLLSNIQKNRKMKLLLFLSCVCYAVQGEFILKSVNMNAQAFKEAQAHNLQSISNSAAGALRDFMTKNHVAFAVDGGEVRLTETYPNEGIPTGHSCSVTAEARDVHAIAYMIPKSASLSPVGVVYDDISKNSFAIANVKHDMWYRWLCRRHQPHRSQPGSQQRGDRVHCRTAAPLLQLQRQSVQHGSGQDLRRRSSWEAQRLQPLHLGHQHWIHQLQGPGLCQQVCSQRRQVQ